MRWRAPLAAWQLIRFVLASNDGLYPEECLLWSAFFFRGRSVYYLRSELARRLGLVDRIFHLIMCVRAGRYGRLTPLFENLPRDGDGVTIDIVVIISQTPGESLSLCSSSFGKKYMLVVLIESILHTEQMLVVLIFSKWDGC